MLRTVLILAIVCFSGCAVFASATASHSGITPCVDDRTYMLVDVIAATVSGALIVASDSVESVWSLSVPGVFALSAILGGIEVHYCNRKAPSAPMSEEPQGRVLYKSGSQNQVVEQPPTPTEGTDPLRLPGDYEVEQNQTPVECTLATKDDCPPNHVCVILGDETGLCRAGK